LVDIGANMLDPMFQGEYREKQRHPSDLPAVLQRAKAAGVGKVIVTAGSLEESREAASMCREQREEWVICDIPELFCTVGVHPTRCTEFETAGPESAAEHIAHLLAVGREGHEKGFVAAIGECGLDYDRLQFCPREVQLRNFELQLTGLVGPLGLPLFLHCRTTEAAQDLLLLLEKHRSLLPTPPGVVHSFDGSLEDAQKFIALGFCIGINGCSLKTAENLEVVRQLPGEYLLLETDAPWCGIKATHAGHRFVKSTWEDVKKPEKWEAGKCVKDRCEPCHLRQVLEVVAGCRDQSPEALAAEVHRNCQRVFF
jgi:TatD DNase family protein